MRTSYRRIRNLFEVTCESHQTLTSFPALNTLSKRFRYARATPSGITSICVIPRASGNPGQRAFAIRRSPAAPRSRLFPLIHQALTLQFFSPTEILLSHNNPLLTSLRHILSACPTLRTGSLTTQSGHGSDTTKHHDADCTQESAGKAQTRPQ